jgi:SET domain-containing protein
MKTPAARRGEPSFEVRDSRVHGLGVFAVRRIPQGMRVLEYLGERVSHEEADRRYESKDAGDNHTFLFIVDGRTVIDAGVGGNAARFVNHACDPNCESVTENRRVFIEAIRTIEPGDELTYDYQIQREPDDPPDVDAIFACRCGSPACRGTMLSPAPTKRARSVRKVSRTRSRKSSRKSGRKAAKKAPYRRAGRR